jgi:hypothetical protein
LTRLAQQIILFPVAEADNQNYHLIFLDIHGD